LKGDVIMARNQETPVTFMLPDNDQVDLITWEFVLKQLDDLTATTLEKMMQSNTHLKNIANKLESFIDDGEEED
jgi:hypothetical protein